MKNYREKSEFPRNKQIISHLYELKLSKWKLASPQDENPLKTHKKTGKNILPEFPVINQASPTTPPTPTSTPTALHHTFLPVFVLHKQ